MTKNEAGDGLVMEDGSWTFGGGVADVFDQHIVKSVPLYEAGQQLCEDLSTFFLRNDSVCYDLGTSTGALLNRVLNANSTKTAIRYYGIDNQVSMIRKCQERLPAADQVEFVCDDILTHDFKPADVFFSYYTVQFLRPDRRVELIRKVFNALCDGGAFIIFEKVRACDSRLQEISTQVYFDYKRRVGYTDSEILSKARSLKSVLIPFTSDENFNMFRVAGFKSSSLIFKYNCFEGYLCIK